MDDDARCRMIARRELQGAAGIGLFFARLDAYERGRLPFVRLADTPFA